MQLMVYLIQRRGKRVTQLYGKRVLVTGGAKGIGLHTATELAKAGCKIIITDIDEDALQDAVVHLKKTGVEVHGRKIDVTNRKAVYSLANWVHTELGSLDVLINNAGIGFHGELAETTLETWKNLIEVNLMGPLYHVYAFLPSMMQQKSGQIVNISSGQAFFRLPTWGAYASVKTALGVFSEILHFELRKHNIDVTTIYPFMVQTDFYKNIQTRTFGSRMSMKLLPYYATTPEKTAQIIVNAIRNKKRVERHSFANTIGSMLQMTPIVSGLFSKASHVLLTKRHGGACLTETSHQG